MECPECGCEYVHALDLCGHIAIAHMTILHTFDGLLRECWCKERFRMTLSVSNIELIAEHFAERGGVAAHYLACRLGVD